MTLRAILLLVPLLLAAACEPTPAPTDNTFRKLTSFGSSPDGRKLYVSPSGSLTAAGTSQEPLDVSSAMSRAVAGDTVVFASGLYPSFTWIKNGTADKPITSQHRPRHFSGAQPVRGRQRRTATARSSTVS